MTENLPTTADVLAAFESASSRVAKELSNHVQLSAMGAFRQQFHRTLGARGPATYTEPRQILELYERLQTDPAFAPPASIIAHGKRTYREVIEKLMAGLYLGRRINCTYLGLRDHLTVDRERRIAQAALQIQEAGASQPAGASFDQDWMRKLGLPWGEAGSAEDWALLKGMLPEATRKRMPEGYRTREEVIREYIEEHWDIFRCWGGDALMRQLLISAGLVDNPQEARTLLAPYVGRVRVRTDIDLDTFCHYPPAGLERAEAQELLADTMRTFVYREIVRAGFDTTPHDRRGVLFADLGAYARDFIAQKQREHPEVSYDRHQHIVQQVIDDYAALSKISLPPGIATTLKTKGVEYPFPSLRQLLSLQAMAKAPAGMLFVLPYAKGKTELMFLLWRYLGLQKLILVGPPSMRFEYPGRMRREFTELGREPCFTPDGEPTVGIIEAGISNEGLEDAVQKDAVIIPYSMFQQRREGRTVLDRLVRLCEEATCFAAFDEVQNARSASKAQEASSYTGAARTLSLAAQTHGGRTGLFSATPFPNRVVEEFIAYLTILDPQVYGDVGGLQAAMHRVGPERFRNAAQQYIFCPDPRENWEEHTQEVRYRLGRTQGRLYREIRGTEEDLQRKVMLLEAGAHHPDLAVRLLGEEREEAMPNACLETLLRVLQQELARERSAFVVLHRYARGYTRPHVDIDPEGRITFCQQLRSKLTDSFSVIDDHAREAPQEEAASTEKMPLHFFIIDGHTADQDREKAIAQMRSSERGDGSRTVIVVLQECHLLEGRDFSDGHVIIWPEGPTDNPSDMGQGLKRLLREGNTRVRGTLLVAEGTIVEWTLRRGQEKEDLANAFLYERSLSDDILSRMSRQEILEAIERRGGLPGLRPDEWAHYVMSDAQRMHWLADRLHGEGSEKYAKFVADHGQAYADHFVANYYRSANVDNNECVAALTEHHEGEGRTQGTRVLDLGCGPASLPIALGPVRKGDGGIRQYTLMDLNPHMIEHGKAMVQGLKHDLGNITFVQGSFTEIEQHLPGQTFDIINCGYALYYTGHNPGRARSTLLQDERVRTLLSINRAGHHRTPDDLPGTLVYITMPPNRCSDAEFENLKQAMPSFGMRVLPECTGRGHSLDGGRRPFENRTLVCEVVSPVSEEELQRHFDIGLLTMTKQREERTGTLRGGHRLGPKPERFYEPHTRFRIGETEVAHTDMQEREEKLAAYRWKLAAVRWLREYHDLHGSFDALEREEVDLLQQWGVQPITFARTAEGHMLFRFIGRKVEEGGEVFDPLDLIWSSPFTPPASSPAAQE